MPVTTFDSRGLHYPPFDEGYKVGRGSLMPIRFRTPSMTLPAAQSVQLLGAVPEDEVWRVVKVKVNDAGLNAEVRWQHLQIALKLGLYDSLLPPDEKNAGAFEAADGAWIPIWDKYAKVTGAGVVWWRNIIGWGYGRDERWILPKDTYETWVNEAGFNKNVYQPAQNLTLSVWPAGAEFRFESDVNLSGVPLTGFFTFWTLVILRLHESDVEAVNPLTIEGLG